MKTTKLQKQRLAYYLIATWIKVIHLHKNASPFILDFRKKRFYVPPLHHSSYANQNNKNRITKESLSESCVRNDVIVYFVYFTHF